MDVCSHVRDKAEILDLRNIRVLSRACRYFEEVITVVGPNAPTEFLRNTLSSILLFTYARFVGEKNSTVTFSLLSRDSELDRIRSQTRTLRPGEEETPRPLMDLLERYRYIHADDLDHVLMNFVRSDLLDDGRLRALRQDFERDSHKRQLGERLQSVWDKYYHGSFRDNLGELSEAIHTALAPYTEDIPPREFDFALELLDLCGRQDLALAHLENFKAKRAQAFAGITEDSWPFGRCKYPPIAAMVRLS